MWEHAPNDECVDENGGEAVPLPPYGPIMVDTKAPTCKPTPATTYVPTGSVDIDVAVDVDGSDATSGVASVAVTATASGGASFAGTSSGGAAPDLFAIIQDASFPSGGAKIVGQATLTDAAGNVARCNFTIRASSSAGLPNAAPMAAISDPGSLTRNVEATFDGTQSSDPDGTIASYEWDWGDGTPDSSGPMPTHTYTEGGTFTVTLIVTDDRGASSNPATLEVMVDDPSAPEICPTLEDTAGNFIAAASIRFLPEGAFCSLLRVMPEPVAGLPDTAPEDEVSADNRFFPGSTVIPPPPAGYTRLAPVVYLGGFENPCLGTASCGTSAPRLASLCFALPDDLPAEIDTFRIAYYHYAPPIDRWVTFPRHTLPPVDGKVCLGTGFRLIPNSFTLFGFDGLD
jgi:PKD repeat protein